ncbi:MAG: GNAT family N-acetyltransferase [Rhodospirillales bacterium]|nr:GNAT family N-acetyltransferase [Rhodospirillales bacterium]
MKVVETLEGSGDSFRVRTATAADVTELVRLRSLLLQGHNTYYATNDEQERHLWQRRFVDWLVRTAPTDNNCCVAVIATPDGTSLTACGIGVVDQRPPGPGILDGRSGWIQSVVTDPTWRRRGMADHIMDYLMCWFRERRVGRVLLHTTSDGANLYHRHGFRPCGEEALVAQLEQLMAEDTDRPVILFQAGQE